MLGDGRTSGALIVVMPTTEEMTLNADSGNVARLEAMALATPALRPETK